jgi:hypothetical protein
VQLEQSPFVTLASDESIRQALRLMSRPLETRLTPEVSRELARASYGSRDGVAIWKLSSIPERGPRSESLRAEAGTGRAVLSPRPFPRLWHPSFAALRIALDEPDHFFHNQNTSVAALRRLTGIIPE